MNIHIKGALEAFDSLIASLKEDIEGNDRYSRWEKCCASEALAEAKRIFSANAELLFGGETVSESASETLITLFESVCNKGDPCDDGDTLFDDIMRKIENAVPSLVEGL